jgi:hypothetical protein
MNGKPVTPLSCHQQHFQEGGKRARYETIPSIFSTPFSHEQIFIFSISSLQGGPHNLGYLHPQNEWEASDTITLLLTSISRGK